MSDVFVSYSSKDQKIADAVVNYLESSKIKCWIAYRDADAGTLYSASIMKAIKTSTIFILVFSENSNKSAHVLKEIDAACKYERIIIPFKIDACQLDDAVEYYLSATHWLDAISAPMDNHLKDLVSVVKRYLEKTVKVTPPVAPVAPVATVATVAPVETPVAPVAPVAPVEAPVAPVEAPVAPVTSGAVQPKPAVDSPREDKTEAQPKLVSDEEVPKTHTGDAPKGKKYFKLGNNYDGEAFINAIHDFIRSNYKNTEVQVLGPPEDSFIQIREKNILKIMAGMASTITLSIKHTNQILLVEDGKGKWLNKIVVTGVAVTFCWLWFPLLLLVTAGIGVAMQQKMKKDVSDFISNYLLQNGHSLTASYHGKDKNQKDTPARKETASKAKCPNCNEEYPAGSRFCRNCGSKL
jgi:hypothetical protein